MLTKRIIACLDVDGGRVVKGVRFKNLRDAGDPAECARAHARNGADEIVFLDITATSGNRRTLLNMVREAARSLFVPFTVGGGIRQVEDAAAVFDAGADKIAINSAAVRDPELIGKIAVCFGSQAVVVAIDAKQVNGGFEVFTAGGRTPTGRDAIQW
ncbi:MAG: HisA/HisF-related TIM barrel protein, partial [Candidatus Sulfotelmatobacter sp.]